MMRGGAIPALGLVVLALAGCEAGMVPYHAGPDTVIATDHDTGDRNGTLTEGQAAVVYDPDGCQGWIIDNGVEGYSGRRFDPVTGLPVCNGLYPPGTVVGPYQDDTSAIPDFIPSR